MSNLHPFFYLKSQYDIDQFADRQYKRLDLLYNSGDIDLNEYADQRCLLENYIDEQERQLNNSTQEN